MSSATPALTNPPDGGAGADELVPLTRLDHADPELMDELIDAIRTVAGTAAFTLGAEVEAFEREFARYCGVEHVVGVSSGTDALALSLRALGLGAGDEVIVPANSFIATAEAVTLAGAVPRFVDVDPATAVLSAEAVEAALGARVRAMIAVHLYGRTVEMNPILELAREHGLWVIEDAAQAHGALYGGRRVGSLAACGCFSFYPSKNLGAWGDGGAVSTDDAELAERVRLFRSHGERPRNHHLVAGTTARLDSIQAAVLRIKLRRLDESNQARRRIARRLDSALTGLLDTPVPPDNRHDHVYHQYVVRHESRDELRRHLSGHGVASGMHYPVPIHLSPAYARTGQARLPISERLAQTSCSLPMYASMSAEELTLVIEACASFAHRRPRSANGR
jgi:dTDP-3-amino-3,4,6-trideoxy-alpha-D-glucose transaminase